MSDSTNERLSELMDGESSSASLIDELPCNEQLRLRWARYHMASDAMHGIEIKQTTLCLADRIRTAIDDEPTVLAPRNQSSSLWQRTSRHAIGFAMAASVAFAVIFGVQYLPSSPGVSGNMAAGDGASDINLVAGESSGQQGLSASEQAELDRLNNYFMLHAEQAAKNGVNGVHPYVRVVSAERLGAYRIPAVKADELKNKLSPLKPEEKDEQINNSRSNEQP